MAGRTGDPSFQIINTLQKGESPFLMWMDR